jgi:formylglycine-generating enzyme required for sulfatase activity
MGGECDDSEKNMPMTEISFEDLFLGFLDSIRKITGTTASELPLINFGLPSVEEWEFAAHGGKYQENTRYAGSDNVSEVAWYRDNSDGRAHVCDGSKLPNWLDIYDMSGNVAEWCQTPQVTDEGIFLWTVCGGHYNSPASEVTIPSSVGMNPSTKEKYIGFRLIIRK